MMHDSHAATCFVDNHHAHMTPTSDPRLWFLVAEDLTCAFGAIFNDICY